MIGGNDPEMQFVHEEDVADLFSLLIEKRVNGPFNLGGDGVMRFSEVATKAGKKSMYVPTWIMKIAMKILWKMHLLVEAPPGIMNYIMFPWVVDTTRAKKELGWKPKYNTEETLKIMLENN